MNKLIAEMEGKRTEFSMEHLSVEQSRPVLSRTPEKVKVGDAYVKAGGKIEAVSFSEVVWQNECCLVFEDDGLGTVIGEMGLCYAPEVAKVGDPCNREVQVRITEIGPKDELMEKLRGKSVRITIEVVPEGNV